MIRDFFKDEKKEAETIYSKGFTDGIYNHYEASLVAKYIRKKQGVGDAKLKTLLVAFCNQRGKYFNYVTSMTEIKNMIKNSKKDWLDKTSPIIISKKELDKIREIKNFTAQKIFLFILISSKRNNGYFNKDSFSYMKSILKLRLTNNEFVKKYIHLLYDLGYVRDSNTNYFITFTGEQSEPALIISTQKQLSNISEIYKDYCGGELDYCKECGAEFVKNGSRHEYCETHSEERSKERHKKYNQKRNFA